MPTPAPRSVGSHACRGTVEVNIGGEVERMAVPGVVALVALVKNGWLKADRDVGRTDGSMERSSLIKSANAGEKSSTSGGNAIGADCSRASAAKRVRSFDGPVGGAAFANVAAKRGCGRGRREQRGCSSSV